jgi:hypothetical protein
MTSSDVPAAVPTDALATAAEELRAMTRPEARAEQVLRWLVDGATALEIRDTILAAWPDADPAALMFDATQKLEAAGQLNPDLVMGFCTQATLQLYKDMRAIGDFAGALSAIKTLSKLHGF